MDREKKYVPVLVRFDAEGKMRPVEIEFEEGQTIFHTLLIASCTKHVIHGEAGSDVPDKINVV